MGGIEIPWPPKELSPNARVHFQTRASHAKSYREYVYWVTRMAPDVPAVGSEGEITLRLDFHPPDARKRDLDNMLASIKNGLDGLADALCVNDQRFALHLYRKDPIKGGKIIVSIG